MDFLVPCGLVICFIGFAAWLMIKSIPAINLRKEFQNTRNQVGPSLIKQFGRKEVYLKTEVDQVAASLQLSPKRTRFAHAVYCSIAEYEIAYAEEVEPGSEFDFSPLNSNIFGVNTAQHSSSHDHHGSHGGGHDGHHGSHGGGHDGHGDGGGSDGGGHGGH